MEVEVHPLGLAIPVVKFQKTANSDYLQVETRQKSKIQSEIPMEESLSDDSGLLEYQRLKQSLGSLDMCSLEPFASFNCPLTTEIMEDPVLTKANQTYERAAIQRWFDEGRFTDPNTNTTLVDRCLTPNILVRRTISEWREKHCLLRFLNAKNRIGSVVDEAELLLVLDDLMDLCANMPRAKDWIAYEGLMPQIVECLRIRRSDIKEKTFALLRVLVKDHDKNKEAVTGGALLELASGTLLRDPPILQAAELLAELVKSKFIRTKLIQQHRVIVAIASCVMHVKDPAVQEIVRSIIEQLSDIDDIVKQMAAVNWYTPLIERLLRGCEESKVAMVLTLAEMQLTKKSVEDFVSSDVISVLIRMIQSGKEEAETSAIRALQNFSSYETALTSMVKGGLVPLVLKSLSAKTSKDYKLAAVEIIKQLISKYGVGYLAQTSGHTGLRNLVNDCFNILGNLTLRVSSTSLHSHLLGLLYQMVLSSDALEVGQLIRDEEGCLQVLLTLLSYKVPEVCFLVLKVFSGICDGKGGSGLNTFFMKDLKPLMELLEDDSVSLEIHYATAEVLAKLSDSDNRDHSISFGSVKALSTLVKLSTLPSMEGKVHAVSALLRFTEAESKFQQVLVDMNFLSSLVDMLSSSSSLLKSRAAMALRNFSRTSIKLTENKAKSQMFWKICQVHNVHCTVKETFCIFEAGAVPKLVALLDDSSIEVVLAALDAVSTLLLTRIMSVKGARWLYTCGAVEKLLGLATGDSLICSDKCLDLLERILRIPEIKNKYVSEASNVLKSLAGCQQSHPLSRKAVRILSELG